MASQPPVPHGGTLVSTAVKPPADFGRILLPNIGLDTRQTIVERPSSRPLTRGTLPMLRNRSHSPSIGSPAVCAALAGAVEARGSFLASLRFPQSTNQEWYIRIA